MSYRDTGGGPQYVPTTSIDLGILRAQAELELRGEDHDMRGPRIAWEHVLDVLAILDVLNHTSGGRVKELEETVKLLRFSITSRGPDRSEQVKT